MWGVGERGVKDDLKALGLSQRKAELPLRTCLSCEKGDRSMYFPQVDLDSTASGAQSKPFKSPGSQGTGCDCRAGPGAGRWLAKWPWAPPPPRSAQKTKEHLPPALQLTKHVCKH